MKLSELLHLAPRWNSADRLSTAIAPGAGKQECARFLDSFQAEAFEKLASRYKDEYFARLLALKLTNLAAARYHLGSRHSTLSSHPVLLMVDPANACQLGCPGCVHSTNKSYGALFDWPRKTLPVETYRAFLDQFGPFAICVALYNYGEPLLNKRFAEIVRASREYLVRTMASTNLSMPLNNVEEIVESGLDFMILSIDGVTQPVYERYRRKGDLRLVLENVRKLVAAKKALGSSSPHLVWQFLTFEHNQHELDEARRLASSIGVDEFNVATPFSVELDDSTIRPVRSPQQGAHYFRRWRKGKNLGFGAGVTSNQTDAIDREFQTSWHTRLQASPSDAAAPNANTCSWLYFNMTMDAAGRVMPCCMAPDKRSKNLVFANFAAADGPSALSMVNSPMAVTARGSFADPVIRQEAAQQSPDRTPFCVHCVEKPSSPYSIQSVRTDIRILDPHRVVSNELVNELTAWDRPAGSSAQSTRV